MSRFTPVRLVVAFCAGILSGMSLPVLSPFHALLPAIIFIFYLVARYLLRFDHKLAWVQGVLAYTAVVTSGYFICGELRLKGSRQDEMLLRTAGQPVSIVEITEKPTSRSGRYSCKAHLSGFADSCGVFHPVSAGVMVSFGNDSSSAVLMPGDRLIAKSRIQPVAPPLNPGTFNYRRYLYYKEVRWQTFLSAGEWQLLPMLRMFNLNRWSEQNRARFTNILERYGISGQELGLAAALILGSRDLLEAGMIKEFSNAGAIHVLSVSGLHVGIMYVLADRILFLLKRGRLGRRLHHLLIIGIIWIYALLTGFPPSVVRASLMFSLISVSNMMDRNVDGFNILAGALLLQLWNNPYDITQLGLQLSYVAVLGIFVFYKPFNQAFADRNSIVSSVWSVIAVSLAAQLATFPLSGYYFGFFPVYFLITNLVVVPLAAIVVYLALAVLVAGIISLPLAWIGWPLKGALWLMHRSVSMIQSFPGAVLEMNPMTDIQMILLYILIAGTALYFIYKQRFGIWMALTALLMFSFSRTWQDHRNTAVNSMTVYSIRKHTAIDLISDGKATCIHDSTLLGFPGIISAQIEPNRKDRGVGEVCEVNLLTEEAMTEIGQGQWMDLPFIYFAGKKLVLPSKNLKYTSDSTEIDIDIAVITGLHRIDPGSFLQHIKAETVVLDGSLPVFSIEKWKKKCLQDSIRCHSVTEDGAFILEW